MDDLLSDFVIEAAETLAGLQVALARMSGEGLDRDAATDALRRLHGLKGLCGFLGLAPAEALAHAGEGLLAGLRDGQIAMEPRTFQALQQLTEQLGDCIATAGSRLTAQEQDKTLVAELESLSALRASPPETAPAASVERRGRAPWSGLDTLARGLGDRLGKRIELAVGGDDVRITREASPPIRTALIALVRNACDHGVEPPAERRAQGKPGRAFVRLSLRRTSAGLSIDLADDGRGVDLERLRERAAASGRLEATTADALSLDRLAFTPGLTTAPAPGEISGRGMGLDLARREIEGLGGRLLLSSEAGRGTRCTLILPDAVIAASPAKAKVAA